MTLTWDAQIPSPISHPPAPPHPLASSLTMGESMSALWFWDTIKFKSQSLVWRLCRRMYSDRNYSSNFTWFLFLDINGWCSFWVLHGYWSCFQELDSFAGWFKSHVCLSKDNSTWIRKMNWTWSMVIQIQQSSNNWCFNLWLSPTLYTTERKSSFEFRFCYFANGKFAKF